MTRLEREAIEFFNKHRDIGFTTSSTSELLKKLLEEVGEFVEAVIEDDENRDPVMEAGDIAMLLVDILNVIGSEYSLSVGMDMALEKLKERHP
jgi:NTP pyrophosphatase (non-canonical NTP hydrolase)